MDSASFYNMAKNYADKLKNEKPDLSSTACLCLIITDTQEIFSGVTGVGITEGNVEEVSAQYNAVASMIVSKNVKAKQMLIINITDYRIITPDDTDLNLLFRASSENGSCEVIIAVDQTKTALQLISSSTSVSEEFLNTSFDEPDETSENLGTPAEFVNGFEFDESNPFAAEPDTSAESTENTDNSPPKFLYNQPDPNQLPPYQGYPQGYPPPQGYPAGYPQGYPTGYPQGYPAGYPQQGYPPQGAYIPPQGAYIPPQSAYIPQGYPQQGGSAYMNHGGSAYMNQGGYPTAAPAGSIYQPQQGGSRYGGQSQMASSDYIGDGGSSFKNRLDKFLDDEEEDETEIELDEEIAEEAAPAAGSKAKFDRKAMLKEMKEKKKEVKLKNKF